MHKKPDLLEAMRSSAKSVSRPPATAAAVMERPEASVSQPPDNPHYRPGRAGKANVTGYFPPAVKKQLRLLSAEHDKTIQRLLGEALNDLFAKYGRPEIAPLDDE
jgi:antitoxin-like ribbon-helix-helix protein